MNDMLVRNHPLYSRFIQMRGRCYQTSHNAYAYYGGRGITVCDRWLVRGQGFWNFVEDMGPCPEGHSLDRIDNDKGYSPENCRWATQKVQYRNQRHPKINAPMRNIRKHRNLWRLTMLVRPNEQFQARYQTLEEAVDVRTVLEYERDYLRYQQLI